MPSMLWLQKMAPTGSAVFTSPLPVYEVAGPSKIAAIAVFFVRINYTTIWSISAHPSILGSVSSLLWPQKLAPTRSAVFTSPLFDYEAAHPRKIAAAAATFYF